MNFESNSEKAREVKMRHCRTDVMADYGVAWYPGGCPRSTPSAHTSQAAQETLSPTCVCVCVCSFVHACVLTKAQQSSCTAAEQRGWQGSAWHEDAPTLWRTREVHPPRR